MTELMKGSAEWSKRGDDESFSDLASLHAAATYYRQQAKEAKDIPMHTLRVQADGDEVLLVGKTNVPSKLTNWSFGQLSARVGAPASYLRELPPTLAAQNLNYGLATGKATEDGERDRGTNLLLHSNGGYVVRAFTSPQYTRIWNNEVSGRIIRLTEEHPQWQPAPAAMDGKRGLYVSDHDCFMFLVDNDRRVFEKDPNGGLSRGFFVWNSEVGAKSFGIMSFLYAYICANHIVWGASGVKELRIRHTGNADDRAFGELAVELLKYSEGSVLQDEALIRVAKAKELGGSKDEVLDAVFGLRAPGLSRKLIEQAYDQATVHEDWYGNPRSVWGMVNGVTEVAQEIKFTDQRVAIEQAASKIMAVAF